MTQFLGLISDTHGHPTYTREGLQVLTAFEPIAILHSGDIGGPEIVDLFPQGTPCHFVRGNCDYAIDELSQAIATAGFHWWGDFADLLIADRRIAVLHGDDQQRLNQSIESGQFDLVVHGHTHVARNERIGSTQVVNPGAIYRANPHTVAVVDVDQLKVEILAVR